MEKTYRQMLDEFIDNQSIDVEELNSYSCKSHNQGFDRFRLPDDIDWDEDEEYNAQCEQAIKKIEEDGLWEWTDIPDEHQEEAIKYIKEKEIVK